MTFVLTLIISDVGYELDMWELITRQLRNLIEHFEFCFSHMGNSWIKNLFLLSKDNINLAKILQNKLLKLAANEGLKMNYLGLELINILSILKLL